MPSVTPVSETEIEAVVAVASTLRPPGWNPPSDRFPRRADGWYDWLRTPALASAFLRGSRDWWAEHIPYLISVPRGVPTEADLVRLRVARRAVMSLLEHDK